MCYLRLRAPVSDMWNPEGPGPWDPGYIGIYMGMLRKPPVWTPAIFMWTHGCASQPPAIKKTTDSLSKNDVLQYKTIDSYCKTIDLLSKTMDSQIKNNGLPKTPHKLL